MQETNPFSTPTWSEEVGMMRESMREVFGRPISYSDQNRAIGSFADEVLSISLELVTASKYAIEQAGKLQIQLKVKMDRN